MKQVKQHIQQIGQSEYVQNVGKLFSGSFLAQLIPIAVLPVITRMYTPEELGTLGLFNTVLGVLVLLATCRYEFAILIPQSDTDAHKLMYVGGMISVFFCLLLFPAIQVLGSHFSFLAPLETSVYYPILLVGSIFVLAHFQLSTYWNNRLKKFAQISWMNIAQSASNSIAKIGFGFVQFGINGLLLSVLVGWFTGVMASKFASIKSILKPRFHKNEYQKIAKEYKNFPMYNMPHAALNNLSGNLPILVFSSYFAPSVVGFYSIAFTLGFKPVSLIAQSILQVNSQHMISLHNQGENILPRLLKMAAILLGVALVGAGATYLLLPVLIPFLLGNEWFDVISMLNLLLPWFVFVFVSSPFSFIPHLFFQQKRFLQLDAVYFTLRLFALGIGIYYASLYLAILLYSLTGVVLISYQLFWYFSLVKNNQHNHLK